MQGSVLGQHSFGQTSPPPACVSVYPAEPALGVLAGWEEVPSLTSSHDKVNCNQDSPFVFFLYIPVICSTEMPFCLVISFVSFRFILTLLGQTFQDAQGMNELAWFVNFIHCLFKQ